MNIEIDNMPALRVAAHCSHRSVRPDFRAFERLGLYNQILTDLNEGREVGPSDLDPGAVGLWCSGYLTACRMDDQWLDDEFAVAQLFPFGILAGEIDLLGEKNSAGDIIEDATPHLEKSLAILPSTVLGLHEYWTGWRRETLPPPGIPIHRPPKVGRNEPCPCGSGRKYKKRCALELH